MTSRKPSMQAKTLAGLQQVSTKVDNVLERTKPWSAIIGMSPRYYYGTATEDVNVFIDEAQRAARHNQWGIGAEAVVRLAYFLEGNAKYAFDAEVSDRVSKDALTTSTKTQNTTDTKTSEVQVEGEEKSTKEDDDSARVESQLDPDGTQLAAWKVSYETARLDLMNKRSELDGLNSLVAREIESLLTLEEELSREENDGNDTSSEGQMMTLEQQEVARSEINRKLKDLKQAIQDKQKDIRKASVAEETFRSNLTRAQEIYDMKAALSKKIAVQVTTTKGTKDDPVDVTVADDDATKAFPTLAGFFDWLREVFEREDVIHAYMSEFYGRRQRRGERVQDYAHELIRLSKRSGMNVDEEERSQHFVDGLTKRMRKHLKREWIKEGLKKREMYQWKRVLEAAKKLERDIPELCVHCPDELEDETMTVNSVIKPHEQTGNAEVAEVSVMSAKAEAAITKSELVDVLKEMMTAIMSQQGRRRSDTCYNCDGVGHLARNCPKPPTERTQRYRATRGTRGARGPVQCYACGLFGH